MKQCDFFSKAQWVCDAQAGTFDFTLLRKVFELPSGKEVVKAQLSVLGLGFFRCAVNGQELTDHAFLPLSTDYHVRENYPTQEELTGHRIYVPQFEVTKFLQEGRNSLVMYFGGGWYTYMNVFARQKGVSPKDAGVYGDPKAIYCLQVLYEDGSQQEILSSVEDKVSRGYVSDYDFCQKEIQDYTDWDDAVYSVDYDDSAWRKAAPAEAVETEYETSDCPLDGVISSLVPEKMPIAEETDLHSKEYEERCHSNPFIAYGLRGNIEIHGNFADHTAFYDCGEVIVGYPVLKLKGKKGEKVTVTFAEALNEDHTLNMRYVHYQQYSVICDGKERTVQPEFTWFGFRGFSVEGPAEVESVSIVHMKVDVTAHFDSSDETLNWLYKAYIRTQLNNLHTGLASDCPTIERRGYTGDGQLTAHAVMTTMDAKPFYEKWMKDISDCQDVKTGHIQYTAPYITSGGGPGAWGCAVVEVPWQFYLHYGETEPLKQMYPQMLRYFDYMESHSDQGLVTRDKEGEWCLGDWCPPMQVILPAPFVNTYYYVKSMEKAIRIARIIGDTQKVPMLKKRIEKRKKAIQNAYFNTWDGNYIGNMQGANAFALDIGLGDERTLKNLVDRYMGSLEYDTGICGTDILIRVLFQKGCRKEAIRLLCSNEIHSFGGMKKMGATTLWEYWPQSQAHRYYGRSLDHPMFGAVAAHLFEYVLGIHQTEKSCGYQELEISPSIGYGLDRASGTQRTPLGDVSVAWNTREDGKTDLTVVIPEGVKASLVCAEKRCRLKAGENAFTL